MHVLIVLLVFVFAFIGLNVSIRYVPQKIKLMGIIIYTAIILRYLTLVSFIFAANIRYLYALRGLYYLNLFFIPLCGFTALYILMRNDRINFNVIWIIAAILALLYFAEILKTDFSISLNNLYFYNMFISNERLVNFILIAVNLVLMFIALLIMSKGAQDKLSIVFVIIALIISLTEITLRVAGIYLLPEMVIGDFCWVFTLDFVLSKFENSRE